MPYLSVVVVRVPRVGAEVGHRRLAGTDVEVHRQPGVGAHLPQRVPGAAGEVGGTLVLRVRGDVDAPEAEPDRPLGLAHHASTSHAGMTAIGSSRFPDAACISALASL